MKSITAAVALLVGLASSATVPYNYASNGKNWGKEPGWEDCEKKGGSPIDLKTDPS